MTHETSGFRSVWLLQWVMWVKWRLARGFSVEDLLEVGDSCELVAVMGSRRERYEIKRMEFREGSVLMRWSGEGPFGDCESALVDLERLVEKSPYRGWKLEWEGVESQVWCGEYVFGGELVPVGLGYGDSVVISGEAVKKVLGSVNEQAWELSGWENGRVRNEWKRNSEGVVEFVVSWNFGGSFFDSCRFNSVNTFDELEGALKVGVVMLWRPLESAVVALMGIDKRLRSVGGWIWGVEVSDDSGLKRIYPWSCKRWGAEQPPAELVAGPMVELLQAKHWWASGFHSETEIRRRLTLGEFRKIAAWKPQSGLHDVVRGLSADAREFEGMTLRC